MYFQHLISDDSLSLVLSPSYLTVCGQTQKFAQERFNGLLLREKYTSKRDLCKIEHNIVQVCWFRISENVFFFFFFVLTQQQKKLVQLMSCFVSVIVRRCLHKKQIHRCFYENSLSQGFDRCHGVSKRTGKLV